MYLNVTLIIYNIIIYQSKDEIITEITETEAVTSLTPVQDGR